MDGEEVRLAAPKDAQELGVGVVHQDYHLFPELTVAQNIFGVNAAPPAAPLDAHRRPDRGRAHRRGPAGRAPDRDPEHQEGPPARPRGAQVRRDRGGDAAAPALPDPRRAHRLAGAERRARACSDLMDRLRAQGVGLAFVSHRLDEIMAIGDRITVLRDGAAIACVPNAETDEAKLADLITGGMDKQEAAKRSDWQPSGDVVLRVTDIRVAPGAPAALLRGRAGRDLRADGPAGRRSRDASCGCSAAPSRWTGRSSSDGVPGHGSATPATPTAWASASSRRTARAPG